MHEKQTRVPAAFGTTKMYTHEVPTTPHPTTNLGAPRSARRQNHPALIPPHLSLSAPHAPPPPPPSKFADPVRVVHPHPRHAFVVVHLQLPQQGRTAPRQHPQRLLCNPAAALQPLLDADRVLGAVGHVVYDRGDFQLGYQLEELIRRRRQGGGGRLRAEGRHGARGGVRGRRQRRLPQRVGKRVGDGRDEGVEAAVVGCADVGRGVGQRGGGGAGARRRAGRGDAGAEGGAAPGRHCGGGGRTEGGERAGGAGKKEGNEKEWAGGRFR
ncbi:hypothetical protein BU14_0027s0060 [Porphyra umbilicalis]|uniref:Uncharacterized protein n=1 Tax=Porphyra umbilicalis TaxID=2786 RepID=A0A1X6PJF8_PORUM|nr:hypothetical protein BU14_0027s0060 [Porphyra umbilicalis]|eukprot:OSX81034.1 hypothetical protein BU14_0027s0060 [Porphyra umbilicalis]